MQIPRMRVVAATALVFVTVAHAQSVPAFPDGAIPIDTTQLQATVAGKSYTIDLKTEKWTVAFEPGGGYRFTAGKWQESGKWTPNKSEICGRDFGGWCNEIRLKDDVLYLKSNSRGILPMALVK